MSSEKIKISKTVLEIPKSSNKTVKQKPLVKNAPVYHILWRDAFSEADEWHDHSSIDTEDYLCHTIGYLIESNSQNDQIFKTAMKKNNQNMIVSTQQSEILFEDTDNNNYVESSNKMYDVLEKKFSK